MAQGGTLHDAFVDELRDASPDLRAAFEAHLEETRGQIVRLEQIFANLGEKVRGKHCDGIAAIIEEGKAADQTLSSLAEDGINEEAASAGHPDQDEDDAEAAPVPTTSHTPAAKSSRH